MIVRDETQLGGLIQTARKNKGRRKIDLSRRASTRQKAISGVEQGAVSARLATVLKLVSALGFDVDLIGRLARSFDPSQY